jgi:16S rRNA (uracil1498-N3)-methyltransferase
LEKIIVSAAKQSKKAYFPVLNPLTPFDQFLKNAKAENRYIAHCYEQDKKQLSTELKGQKDVLILIGPEGDFSKEEVDTAMAAGFIPVTLGDSRLRTETQTGCMHHSSTRRDISTSQTPFYSPSTFAG